MNNILRNRFADKLFFNEDNILIEIGDKQNFYLSIINFSTRSSTKERFSQLLSILSKHIYYSILQTLYFLINSGFFFLLIDVGRWGSFVTLEIFFSSVLSCRECVLINVFCRKDILLECSFKCMLFNLR